MLDHCEKVGFQYRILHLLLDCQKILLYNGYTGNITMKI